MTPNPLREQLAFLQAQRAAVAAQNLRPRDVAGADHTAPFAQKARRLARLDASIARVETQIKESR